MREISTEELEIVSGGLHIPDDIDLPADPSDGG